MCEYCLHCKRPRFLRKFLFRTSKIRKQAATKFIISLAVSDLLFSGINIPSYGYGLYSKNFLTTKTCPPIGFFYMVNASVSIYSMALVTLNYYVKICHNSQYNNVS